MASSPAAPSVVAFGGADRALRVWDCRARVGEALAVRPLESHAGWVSCVAWRPASAHHVATASHDGTAKLWDLRTAVPLATLALAGGGDGAGGGGRARQAGGRAGEDKALAVAWAGEGGAVLAGGTDCVLRRFA